MISVDTDFFSLLFITICSICVLFVIGINKKLQFRNLILLGFLLRIFLMIADYYHWFPIPNSGVDSENFHKIALENQKSLVWRASSNYTYFLTYIYNITNSSRLIAQYINVLFGLGVMIFVQRSLFLLEINRSIQKRAMWVVVLLPNLIIFSGILLREAWVEFFAAASLFYFIRWFRNGSKMNMILAFAMVVIAAIMHSGIIGLLMGYILAFLIYNPKKQRVHFSGSSIVALILLAGIMTLFLNYSGIFASKIEIYNFDDPDTLIEITNRINAGGSDYLTWLKADNVALSLLLTPLKIFYFLFSPLPTEWRGISDIIGFCVDGAVYLWLCIGIFRSKCSRGFGKLLKTFLATSMLVTVFIFAYGTSNAGTAFRHRAKIMPLIIVAYAASLNYSTNSQKKLFKKIRYTKRNFIPEESQ